MLDQLRTGTVDQIVGILKCANPNCITNQPNEPVRSKFKIVSRDELLFRCFYCKRYLEAKNQLKQPS